MRAPTTKKDRRIAISVVLSRGYFQRPEGPEVTCPCCGQRVQCTWSAHRSTRTQITEAMEFHFDGYCGTEG